MTNETLSGGKPNKDGFVAIAVREPIRTPILQELVDSGLNVFDRRDIQYSDEWGGSVVARRDGGVLTNAQIGILNRFMHYFQPGYYTEIPRLKAQTI